MNKKNSIGQRPFYMQDTTSPYRYVLLEIAVCSKVLINLALKYYKIVIHFMSEMLNPILNKDM